MKTRAAVLLLCLFGPAVAMRIFEVILWPEWALPARGVASTVAVVLGCVLAAWRVCVWEDDK